MVMFHNPSHDIKRCKGLGGEARFPHDPCFAALFGEISGVQQPVFTRVREKRVTDSKLPQRFCICHTCNILENPLANFRVSLNPTLLALADEVIDLQEGQT
jgi:hypothetical protein